MQWTFLFFANSILFGIGLAMDAFSVSMANGLNEPQMPRKRMGAVAGTFALFQTVMPLIGWLCIRTISTAFAGFQQFIPWIALLLLLWIGGKMLLEGLRGQTDTAEAPAIGFWALIVQGIATSIDALSVGFTIADYAFPAALAESLIIGIVTFGICFAGVFIGKKFGTRLAGKASVLGGIILIVIGLEIFLTGIL